MSRSMALNVLSVLIFTSVPLGIIYGMYQARGWVRETYGDGTAQVDWNTWVSDVKESEDEGNSPVTRRVPKSNEPPGLVLMRDYFFVCLVICLVLSLALAAVFNFMIRGVLRGQAGATDDETTSIPA